MRFFVFLIALLLAETVWGEPLRLDLRNAAQTQGWKALHDLAPLEFTPQGMIARSTGSDPYLHTATIAVPDGKPLVMTLRAQSATGGSVQVFYFPEDGGPSEGRSVRFSLPGGGMQEIAVALPPLEARTRLRIDPPIGETVFESLTLEPRLEIPAPPWPKIEPMSLPETAPQITSDTAKLRHLPDQWNAFVLEVDGTPVAAGHPRPFVGYRHGAEVRWLDVNAPSGHAQTEVTDGVLTCIRTLKDPEGGTWTFQQSFKPASLAGGFDVASSIACDQPREIAFVPSLLVCPGLGTHGSAKTQALFAGVEYLDHDPSSSEADVIGPGALRRVPAATKITFPLMAVQHENHWSALIWETAPDTAPLFDSPDRTMASGSHLMGLIAPGPNPNQRTDGDVFPFRPDRLEPNQPIQSRATLLAGTGKSVVPAIQAYVALRKLPDLPVVGDPQDYIANAARGWLDTEIRDGDRFRHALPTDRFKAQPAADAAWMMEQLAALSKDTELSARLKTTSELAWKAVEGKDLVAHRVGHTVLPVAPLLRGDICLAFKQARQRAEAASRRFDADGRVLYQPRPEKDYGTTHWSREANGITALVVAQFLEDAAFSGDRKLIAEAVERLRGLDKFANTVPRGAQTWEIPLHTPDILAASHLVRAYVLGYELTGDEQFLASAKYWAWTGVPFVYLVNPTKHPIGPYATIAVLGATNWEAPLWIGLPVQWCGLCYADAILRLVQFDPDGPWKTLAYGIARSGIQQTYPPEHPQHGLLPDSFTLDIQQRNIFDINPGTLHPVAMLTQLGHPPYAFTSIEKGRILAHVPGIPLGIITGTEGTAIEVLPSFARSSVVLHGVGANPVITINRKVVELTGEHLWIPETETAVLRIGGRARIAINPPLPRKP